MNQGERDKLRILLDYWVKHNDEHGEEFREWAEKSRDLGVPGLRDDLLGASNKLSEANELLLDALQKLKD